MWRIVALHHENRNHGDGISWSIWRLDSSALMKLATIPTVKTLEQFDAAISSGERKPRACAPGTCRDAENVVLLAPSRVGKTHITVVECWGDDLWWVRGDRQRLGRTDPRRRWLPGKRASR
jgi:hypothetical protein